MALRPALTRMFRELSNSYLLHFLPAGGRPGQGPAGRHHGRGRHFARHGGPVQNSLTLIAYCRLHPFVWKNPMPAYAIAVDVREAATNAVVGVALLVPEQRYAAYLAHDLQAAIAPAPTAAEWREIDAWHRQAEAGLPSEPPRMDPAVTSVVTGRSAHGECVGRRFAAIPIGSAGDDLAAELSGILPGLLKARRTSARSTSHVARSTSARRT